MKLTKPTFLILVLVTLSHAASAYEPVVSTDRDEINTSCASDAKKAACPKKAVGNVLAYCITLKQSKDPTFQISSGCKTAIEKRKEDKAKADAKAAPKATPRTPGK